MKLLPKWLLRRSLPAYHDHESATILEAQNKVYNAMNELIEEYNKWVDETNVKLQEFFDKYNEDIELFTTSLRQEFQNFIDVVNLKVQQAISEIDSKINEIFGNVAEETKQEIYGWAENYLTSQVSNLEASLKAYVDSYMVDTINETWDGEY